MRQTLMMWQFSDRKSFLLEPRGIATIIIISATVRKHHVRLRDFKLPPRSS
jgi:hypothetical protein